MGNIDFFKRELTNSFKHHLAKELAPRLLQFIKSEVNFVIDNKINELRKNNDNTIKPQHNNRKGKNPNSTQRAR